MKKLWAILLAVVMVVGALSLASCGGNPDTTTAATTTAGTTAGTTQASTTAEATTAGTTAASTTAAGTTAASTTAAATTAAGTTAAATTAGTTAEATTATEATTTTKADAAEGTTLPIYARLDFGSGNHGDDNDWVCDHDWLLERIVYNEACIKLIWQDDALQIYAMASYSEDNATDDFMIEIDQLVDYDWEGDIDGLIPGWGTWDLMPYSDQYVGVEGRWAGDHQFMQIRLINNTKNNMIGFAWSNSGSPGFFTTLRCANMYLQGGEGVNTCDPTTEYAVYTYDVMFLNAAASGRFSWTSTTYDTGSLAGLNGETAALSFTTFEAYKAARLEYPGSLGGNNWNKTRSLSELNALKFYLLGYPDAWSASRVDPSANFCDTRANVVMGTYVTVDYIIFGSTAEQLDAYKSRIELEA